MRISDWSSDVCSSDLLANRDLIALGNAEQHADRAHRHFGAEVADHVEVILADQRIETARAQGADFLLDAEHALGRDGALHRAAVRRMHRRIQTGRASCWGRVGEYG